MRVPENISFSSGGRGWSRVWEETQGHRGEQEGEMCMRLKGRVAVWRGRQSAKVKGGRKLMGQKALGELKGTRR